MNNSNNEITKLSQNDIKNMLNNEDLIKVKSYNRFFDPVSLTKAYKFALNAHKIKKENAGNPI